MRKVASAWISRLENGADKEPGGESYDSLYRVFIFLSLP